MGLSEEWKQLPGKTKMFIIGGGGIALFFLLTAIKNRNSQQNLQQDTSIGPQTAAVDPTSWMDTQTQQMQSMQQLIGGVNDAITQYQQSSQQSNQQNMQAMQDLIQQNQQGTQQQIGALLDTMSQAPKYPSAPGPAPSMKSTKPLFDGGNLTTKETRFLRQMNDVSNPSNAQLQTLGSIATKTNVSFDDSKLSSKQQRFIRQTNEILASGKTLSKAQQQTLGSLVNKAGTIK